MIQSELYARPDDVYVNIRLVELYCSNKRLKDAVAHCHEAERNIALRSSLEWNSCVVQTLKVGKNCWISTLLYKQLPYIPLYLSSGSCTPRLKFLSFMYSNYEMKFLLGWFQFIMGRLEREVYICIWYFYRLMEKYGIINTGKGKGICRHKLTSFVILANVL